MRWRHSPPSSGGGIYGMWGAGWWPRPCHSLLLSTVHTSMSPDNAWCRMGCSYRYQTNRGIETERKLYSSILRSCVAYRGALGWASLYTRARVYYRRVYYVVVCSRWLRTTDRTTHCIDGGAIPLVVDPPTSIRVYSIPSTLIRS